MNDGGSVVIKLLRGETALVSAVDAPRVSQFTWRLGSNGYVYCRQRTNQPHTLLHRFILNAEAGAEVHHRNETPIDCQRNNLELTNPSQHQKDHHAHLVAARNASKRLYPVERVCLGCGITFVVHPDHRGRNRFHSKACGNKNRRNSKI